MPYTYKTEESTNVYKIELAVEGELATYIIPF